MLDDAEMGGRRGRVLNQGPILRAPMDSSALLLAVGRNQSVPEYRCHRRPGRNREDRCSPTHHPDHPSALAVMSSRADAARTRPSVKQATQIAIQVENSHHPLVFYPRHPRHPVLRSFLLTPSSWPRLATPYHPNSFPLAVYAPRSSV
jgi:hypothetical protein